MDIVLGTNSRGFIQSSTGSDNTGFTTASIMSFDYQSPTFSSAEVIGNELTVKFSEILDPALTSMSGFKWKVEAGGRTIKVRSVEILPDSATATLFLAKAVDINDTVLLSYDDLSNDESVNVIQDLDGNDLESFSNESVRNESMPDEQLDIILSEIEGNEIVIGFDREIDVNSIPNTGMFRVYANRKRIKVTNISLAAAKREATITLAAPISGANDVIMNYIDAKGDQATNVIQDTYGNDLDSFRGLNLDNVTDRPSFDGPSVMSDGVILDGKTLEIEFDELLQGGKVSKNRFKIKAGGKKVKVTSAFVPEGENYVVCELKDLIPTVYESRGITVSYRDIKGDNKSNVLQDLSGNDVETFRNVAIEMM